MIVLLVFTNILQLIVLMLIMFNIYYVKKEPKKNDIKTKRRSGNIKSSDYSNVFNNRTSYKIYQNQNGLYEPQRPSRGIEIKKEVK